MKLRERYKPNKYEEWTPPLHVETSMLSFFPRFPNPIFYARRSWEEDVEPSIEGYVILGGVLLGMIFCGCLYLKEDPSVDSDFSPGRTPDYTRSPAFLIPEAVRKEREKKKKKNTKPSPRWWGSNMGVYQKVESSPVEPWGVMGVKSYGALEEGNNDRKVRSSSFHELELDGGGANKR